MQRKTVTPENAIVRLESQCARAEHCTGEIMAKLRTWGITGAEADRIVNHLTTNRFVDDLRFAKSFVRDRYRFAGYGRRKIALLLMTKHLERDIIDEAMDEIDEEVYGDILRHIIARKAKGLDLELFEDRNKLYRYIVGRGFETSLASRAIKEHIAAIRRGDEQD